MSESNVVAELQPAVADPRKYPHSTVARFLLSPRYDCGPRRPRFVVGTSNRCAIAVHRALGPGLLESVYRECLIIELKAEKIQAERDQRVALTYRGEPIEGYLTLDLLIEGRLVVELKSVEQIKPVHLAQVITYLKLTGHPAGLLLNFNSPSLRAGLRRLQHPDLYVRGRNKTPEA